MRLSHSAMACSSAIAALYIGVSGASAASVDQYDCGDSSVDLVLEVRINAEKGKASLKSARGLVSLKPNGEGAWVDAEQVIQFYPEDDGPKLFFGSEQFSCSMMVADNQNTVKTTGTVNSASNETGSEALEEKVETMAAKPEEMVKTEEAAESEEMVKLEETAETEEMAKPEEVMKPEPQLGKSYGGRVRSGPGTNFDQTDSLTEGDAVEIVANSGARLNGFDWFEIRYSEGLTGFQWGGILCSNGEKVEGIYKAC